MNKHIHFSHANGIPASTYSYLFDQLEGVQIHCIEKMGHGDYPVNVGLHHLADELIESIEQKSTAPVIGIGHSAGGLVTLLAAAKRPELFKKVIVLDPILFSKRKRAVISSLRAVGLGDWLGPTKRTLIRRTQFDHHAQADEYFSSKTLFKNFHPECFKDYIKHGLRPRSGESGESGEGVELAFSKTVEADIFRSVSAQVPANLDKVDGVVIYGSQSKLFWPSDVKWWQKHYPNFTTVAFAGEHLFPLEKPDEVARLLNEFIAK
jgi:pimeloyl-ACP methyl ester carboxylesterase